MVLVGEGVTARRVSDRVGVGETAERSAAERDAGLLGCAEPAARAGLQQRRRALGPHRTGPRGPRLCGTEVRGGADQGQGGDPLRMTGGKVSPDGSAQGYARVAEAVPAVMVGENEDQ